MKIIGLMLLLMVSATAVLFFVGRLSGLGQVVALVVWILLNIALLVVNQTAMRSNK